MRLSTTPAALGLDRVRARALRSLALLPALLLGASTGASAQTPEAVARAERTLASEPSVAESTRKALTYFRLDPSSFDRLRRTSRSRALLPILAAGYRYDDDSFARFEAQNPTPLNTREDTRQNTHSVNVGALWDLRQLAFNPAEVQVYGLVGVQRDILLEVTRTYFLRRQLQMRMMLKPPDDALARAALQLRVEEFTAVLDVLTGGWFSEESDRRRGGAARR